MPTILAVDDDTTVCALIRHFLGADYTILTASSVGQALLLLETSIPDLLLIDELLPDMRGHEFCHRLEHNPRLRQIPRIMMSASTHYIVAGTPNVLMYIRKPFRREQLLMAVSDVLGE